MDADDTVRLQKAGWAVVSWARPQSNTISDPLGQIYQGIERQVIPKCLRLQWRQHYCYYSGSNVGWPGEMLDAPQCTYIDLFAVTERADWCRVSCSLKESLIGCLRRCIDSWRVVRRFCGLHVRASVPQVQGGGNCRREDQSIQTYRLFCWESNVFAEVSRTLTVGVEGVKRCEQFYSQILGTRIRSLLCA